MRYWGFGHVYYFINALVLKENRYWVSTLILGHVYYLIKTEHNLGQAVIGDNKHELRVACYGLRVASIGVRYAGYAPVECRVASSLWKFNLDTNYWK